MSVRTYVRYEIVKVTANFNVLTLRAGNRAGVAKIVTKLKYQEKRSQ